MEQRYRIESVTLRDTGVFEHTHIEFPGKRRTGHEAKKAEIHIFTGPNGCGKSTMLYALAGIFSHGSPNLSPLHQRFRSRKASVACRFCEERAVISAGNERATRKTAMAGDEQSLLTSYRILSRSEHWPVEGCVDFAAFAYSGQRSNREKLHTSKIEELAISPFEDALSFDATVRPAVLANWIANNRTKAALARLESAESEAEIYDESLLRICRFVKNVSGLTISFRLERSPLGVKVELEGESIEYDVLPDGLKSIISWIADLALRLESVPWRVPRDIFSQPIILFLDEVDIHLHPGWQRRILPAIQTLLPNAQVFVSTHSPFVVGSVEGAWVYRLPEQRYDLCKDSGSMESITAMSSSAGKSYQLILSEVFDINEEFDVETECQLAEFKRALRKHIVDKDNEDAVMQLAALLQAKGEELNALVTMELRQMQRLLAKYTGD
ncbi:AAA family ATPase [Pseudocitrobacter cyperus]|uniref:AAA family ATPase n=1 Tax=Pseudocitrobacter cyperus TaxID=3112843 RepID=A0ABV0HM09_9ENTR